MKVGQKRERENHAAGCHWRAALAFAAAGAVTAMATPVRAGNGTWTGTAGGTWGDPLNWSGGTAADVADGAGFTADFNTVDLPADLAVTLDAPRTIGNLSFGDTDGITTPAGWNLSGTNTLTLSGTS